MKTVQATVVAKDKNKKLDTFNVFFIGKCLLLY